jgi:hypothetical protein
MQNGKKTHYTLQHSYTMRMKDNIMENGDIQSTVVLVAAM